MHEFLVLRSTNNANRDDNSSNYSNYKTSDVDSIIVG